MSRLICRSPLTTNKIFRKNPLLFPFSSLLYPMEDGKGRTGPSQDNVTLLLPRNTFFEVRNVVSRILRRENGMSSLLVKTLFVCFRISFVLFCLVPYSFLVFNKMVLLDYPFFYVRGCLIVFSTKFIIIEQ